MLLLSLAEQLVLKLEYLELWGCINVIWCRCCLWKLESCNLSKLSCCDLSLPFFGLVLYSTKKFCCHIPGCQKVLLLQVFNLGVEIVAEWLLGILSRILLCTQETLNHRLHLLELIYKLIFSSGGGDSSWSVWRACGRWLMSDIWCHADFHLRFSLLCRVWNWSCGFSSRQSQWWLKHGRFRQSLPSDMVV